MDEMKTKIENHIKEEIEDHNKYAEMAKMAKSNGMHKLYGILHDIAKDEKMHSMLLMQILEEED